MKLFVLASSGALALQRIRNKNSNRACLSIDEEYACYTDCNTRYNGCVSQCEVDDSQCVRDCILTFGECEENCPCRTGCEEGCPCVNNPIANTYCSICESEDCLSFVDIVLSKMDLDADPCNDFNQYACGGWEESAEIPDDAGSYSQFSVVRKALSATLNRTLSDPSVEGHHGWESVIKSKNLFSLCMDEESLDAQSDSDLAETITISWPTQGILDEEKNVQHSITSASANYGVSAIFIADQDLDADDSTEWIVTLGHPGLGMSQTYYTTTVEADRERYREAYIKYIVDYSLKYRESLSTSATEESIRAMAEKIYNFESNIAKYMWSPTEGRDPANYQRKKVVGEIPGNEIVGNWDQFVNEIISKVNVDYSIEVDTIVNLSDEKWFNNTNLAIDEAGMGNDDLLDYVAWRVHSNYIGYLGAEWRAISDEFTATISGQTPKPRWQTCSDAANSVMEWAVGKLYIEEDFQGESKEIMTGLVDNLFSAFRENILSDADWMSSETKVQALDKLEKITSNIAFPDWINEEDAVNEKYATLEVSESYVGTRRSGKEWQQREWWSLLNEPVDKGMWLTGPAIVNAFYSSSFNSITFPAGILQPPFFSKDMTTAMNFGGIGVVIGHEITHGFDDQGSKYDGDGNYKNWWTPIDRENFDERVQCIKDEYSGFYFEEADKNLNGDLTAGENTADNGGLWEARYGYDWYLKNSSDIYVPGLSDKFTPDQLYYIGYAQIWCAKYKEDYAKWMVDNDPHSPGRFRTNGAIQNGGRFFSNAFGCKKGSPMNPENQCRVW